MLLSIFSSRLKWKGRYKENRNVFINFEYIFCTVTLNNLSVTTEILNFYIKLWLHSGVHDIELQRNNSFWIYYLLKNSSENYKRECYYILLKAF
jgi:hypothetical protein